MIAHIRVMVDFEKPVSPLRPIQGTLQLRCDCGRQHTSDSMVTKVSAVCCYTCPDCGLHLPAKILVAYRDLLFQRFYRRMVECN